MKKRLLFLFCFCLFAYGVVAQENEADDTNSPISLEAGMLISQLKTQLKSQLKSQLESQLLEGLQSKSDNELNSVIDSMLLQLEEDIARVNDLPEDSLALIDSFMKNMKFSMNEQEPDEAAMFDRDVLMKFHDKFYAEMLLMRDNLMRVRAMEDQEMKAQRLSDTIFNFFNDSGFWEIMEMMFDKMMSLKPKSSE